jgi:hypothetical protein
VVQSLIAVQPITISADKQAFQEDPQWVAARIAARLREAGYLCTVLESTAFPSANLQPK